MTGVSQEDLNREIINKSSRVLIKFGSSLLVDDNTGEVRMEWLKSVAEVVFF